MHIILKNTQQSVLSSLVSVLQLSKCICLIVTNTVVAMHISTPSVYIQMTTVLYFSMHKEHSYKL